MVRGQPFKARLNMFVYSNASNMTLSLGIQTDLSDLFIT